MPEQVYGLAACDNVETMEESLAFFASLCYQDGRACRGFVAGKRCYGAGRPGLLSQENLSCGPVKPAQGSCPVHHLPALPGLLNLCHTSTVSRDLGQALRLLWVLEGSACISRTFPCHGISAGQQQEILQGKPPFPTLKINLYLSLT